MKKEEIPQSLTLLRNDNFVVRHPEPKAKDIIPVEKGGDSSLRLRFVQNNVLLSLSFHFTLIFRLYPIFIIYDDKISVFLSAILS